MLTNSLLDSPPSFNSLLLPKKPANYSQKKKNSRTNEYTKACKSSKKRKLNDVTQEGWHPPRLTDLLSLSYHSLSSQGQLLELEAIIAHHLSSGNFYHVGNLSFFQKV